MRGDAETRFWAKVKRKGDGSCWRWTASTDTKGYGHFWFDNRLVPAHRFAYELLVGPIPDGLQLDHLCRTRHCVNPDHLEPVTNRVNTLRGETVTAANAVKTHCPRGHTYDEANTYRFPSTGGRGCRTCMRAYRREWMRRYRRMKEKATPYTTSITQET